jgi:Macrocin-O-methyltransferase (TylF)
VSTRREIRSVAPRADRDALRAAYLELLKLALCDLVGVSTRTVATTGDGRLFSRELTGDQVEWRTEGKDWPQNALTMVGLTRLDDLQRCVESVVADGVQGDLIEAGSWRGGASILMRATLDALGAHDRTVWVADSFQGFPLPESSGDAEDHDLDRDLSHNDYLAAPLEDVRGYFARFGCNDGVEFVPGFFEETLARLRGRRWAVLRLDGDTYKATRTALEALYPGLCAGGYVTVDDYHHPYVPMCRRAVDDFRREHAITEPIEQIDFSAGRWRRESEPTASLVLERRDAPAARTVARRKSLPIPTDRELQLADEVAALQGRLEAVQAELERLRGSPFAGPSEWARRKARRSTQA